MKFARVKPQQQALLLGALSVVMAVVYWPSLIARHASKTVASPTAAAGPSGSEPRELADSPDVSVSRRAQRNESMQLAWARDPFVRGASTDGASGLSLSGILWDVEAPLAMISGQTLRVGEEIGGFRVMQIEPDQVTLTDGHETVTLSNTP